LQHCFHDVLGSARDQREVSRRHERQHDEDAHRNPRVEHVLGNARNHENGGMLDGAHITYLASRAWRRPNTIRIGGNTDRPTSTATGGAPPLHRTKARAPNCSKSRAPTPSDDMTPPPPPPAVAARRTPPAIQRKLPSEMRPPASPPRAAALPPTNAP